MPGRAPGTMPRSFLPSRASRRPWSNRVGAPIHSGSRWWPNWSKGCCDLTAPTGSAKLDALSRLVLSVFDRYPVPASLGVQAWSEARTELARRLQLAGMHAPKRAFDICEPWAETYFNLMPIHEKLRGRDFQTIRNYLKVTLCNIHDEFSKRMDAQALAAALHRQGP